MARTSLGKDGTAFSLALRSTVNLLRDLIDKEHPKSHPMRPKFSLGRVVAAPGALSALAESGQSPAFFLNKHIQGDWGDVCDEDKALNDAALLVDGSRLLSSYTTMNGMKIWIITEAVGDDGNRESSCLLIPQEY